MALVFYDTETTGTETFFDQILQFAAVRTDDKLNEIDRFEIRSQLLPHVVPAPEAIRINGIRISRLTDHAIPTHYEMVRKVSAKFEEWSPALFAGWNSIDFDEILVRQALYKTLHNPYLTSRINNSRSDVMRIVQACSLFAPSALVIPTNDEGRNVFKLSQVASANGFNHDLAHDAVADVEATIYLCRLVRDKAPSVWSAFMRFSKKASVIAYITEERIFCVSDYYMGWPFSHLVTTIGQNQENKAEYYVFDLNVNPVDLESLTDEELRTRLQEYPKPVRRLKANAAPILFPSYEAPECCKGREIGDEEMERRAEHLQNDQTFRDRLILALEAESPKYPKSPHVEKKIYDAFFDRADETLMEIFHRTQWERRLPLVERFKDERLKAIGRHLIYLERPHLLDTAIKEAHEIATAKRLLGQCEDVSWLTLPEALSQLEGMVASALDDDLINLQEHQAFLLERHAQAVARLGLA